MRFLHTADWHLGKVLKGLSRLDEQRRVMAEIVAIAEREAVDVALIAGDVFDTTTPSPEAQQLAWSTLLALKRTCRSVVVIAGNHDSSDSFEALRPVFEAAGVTLTGRPRRPHEGGMIDLGDEVRIALVPFLSQRGAVRAAELFDSSAAETRGRYAEKVRDLVSALTESFDGTRVNIIVAHATLTGGTMGGGEREAHSIFDYHVPALVFPPSASYVALGHLHRTQQVPGPCPIWYPGSPIGVDFGDETGNRSVILVDAEAGRPAVVRAHELASARPLVTLTGTLEEIRGLAAPDDALIRVIITEPARAGLVDDVRSAHPGIIEVRMERAITRTASRTRTTVALSPSELFASYLIAENVDDQPVRELFDRLLEEAQPSSDMPLVHGRLF